MNRIEHTITCEGCDQEIDLMLYPATPGSFDPSGRSHTDCDPQPAYIDPFECPDCQQLIDLESNEIEALVGDYEQGYAERNL